MNPMFMSMENSPNKIYIEINIGFILLHFV